ncbi:hypothetical protein CAPTEDRAFT_225628 [Capitella teleta]|uniref:Uncharacterized protein n=1 Tax=Capitella teleta TaxID=283909 RepID=R7U4Z7_CAPTE|nr:hypothetical protein CAPTEDRAFT_225628 [Capitella teleta]|eukprot:ELU01415.1 hypothetical protein CAPTEDRAFT_225628 [Capitella teleta]
MSQDPCALQGITGGVSEVVGLTSGNPVFTCRTDILNPATTDADRFKGYTHKEPSPMFRTSNSDYGSRGPSVHTVPTSFHPKTQSFSNHLGVCGMPRNHSLNCALDKSLV